MGVTKPIIDGFVENWFASIETGVALMTKTPTRAASRGAVTTATNAAPNLEDAPQEGTIPTPSKKPTGGALQQIFALLADASTEAETGLETALSGLEEAVTQYLAVMRLAGEEGAESSAQALRTAKDRLGAVLDKLGGHNRAVSATPSVRQPRTAPAGGKPRGAASEKVLALLADVPAGLAAGVIIDRLQATDDKEKQSIRNFLASGKKNGTLKYDEKTKIYAKA